MTTAFKNAWRSYTASRVTLVQIDLTVPSSRTLRYATHETHTPDGNTWQEGVTCETVRESVDLLGTGMDPVDATIRFAKVRDASQSSTGGTIHDLLSSFLFQNAVVTIYLWEATLTSFSDALQVFKGRVSRPVEMSVSGVSLYLLQDMAWNKLVPPTVVDKVSYPDSPDGSQGQPIPIAYGNFNALNMRTPWTSALANKSLQEDSGAGLGAVPLILVDSGVGAAKVKLVAACHLCTDILSRANGRTAFIVGGNLLSPLDVTGITATLAVGESKLEITDENTVAYAAIIPMDVRASENTATNPKRAMDPFDETSFASLDQSTTHGILQLILPNANNLGQVQSVQYYVAWSGNAGNANNLRIQSRNPAVGFGTTTANWVATATTPAVQTGTWATADWGPTQAWDFGSGGTTHAWDVRIDFVAGAANKASIYWVALVVKYRPQRSTVTPGSLTKTYVVQSGHKSRRSRNYLKEVDIIVEPTLKLEGQFYGNIQGQPDDFPGTFTGVSASLIEKPPDILRHLMVTYGGVAGSDFQTGAGVSGSFVDVRSTLRNGQASDIKLAAWLGDRTTVQRAAQAIALQGGLCVYLDRLSNKWLAYPWKVGAISEYDIAIGWDDTGSFTAEETSTVDVRHAIRIKYGYDNFKGKTLFEAFVNDSGSSQGFTSPTTRDQLLKIVGGVNDRLDYNFAATDQHLTLTATTYTKAIDLASEVQGKMRVASGGTELSVGWGFSIKAGYNDVIAFIRATGPTNHTATLNPGDYTAESLAAECARAMNTVVPVGVTIGCSYDHSVNLFTWTIAGDTMEMCGLDAGVPPGTGTSANKAMGNLSISPGGGTYAASITAAIPRYRDRFWFSVNSSSIFNNKWSSGTNAATNCATTMGYDKTDSGFVNNNTGGYTRGTRETDAATFVSYYGPRDEDQVVADFIRDEVTAVEFRNRLFDFSAKPRTIVRFNTFRMPDAHRMMTFQFDATINPKVAFPRYGSDGSWVGKTMRILQVDQGLGPNYSTEILAISAE